MSDSIVDQVRARYAAVARTGTAADGAHAVAQAFGYTAAELAALPEGANLGLSCGNPTATAHLRPGETVVDLGCGGGLDVFLAARKVGPTGRAIGIDMTEDMIARARANAAKVGNGTPPANVEFLLGRIEKLPLPDGVVDCLLSNCVINLAPDKSAVFREMFRVLKPGGRVAVSDIALKQPLPAELADDILAYVGCIAGALHLDDYPRLLRAAGFASVEVVDAGKDLNAYALAGNAGCCAPQSEPAPADPFALVTTGCCPSTPADPLHDRLADLLQRYDVNAYAASVQVYALKPTS